MLVLNLLVAAYALLMLYRHGPRAVLFLAPRAVRVSGDPDAPARTAGQAVAGEVLEGLGFRRLGLRRERSPLGALDLEVDSWVHPDGTCADAFPSGGRAPPVALLTTFADGFQVGTSNFRRPAASGAAGRLGGVDGADVEETLAAHKRVVDATAGAHGGATPPADLAGRVDHARRYYAGIGASELRRPALLSLLNALIALLLFGWSLRLVLRDRI